MTERELSLRSACAPVVYAISSICGIACLSVAALVMTGAL